jgi:hypothetical protein|tara:strand:- start:955 stop:1431 length:477 start_codon:yes stop_codon:yes gene_type:complete
MNLKWLLLGSVLVLPAINVGAETIISGKKSYQSTIIRVGDKMPRPSFTRKPMYEAVITLSNNMGERKRVGTIEAYKWKGEDFSFVRRDCSERDFTRPVAAFSNNTEMLYIDKTGNKIVDEATDDFALLKGTSCLPSVLLRCKNKEREEGSLYIKRKCD